MVSHTFLSLDMNLIPDSTKNNVPTFWKGRFSNDMSRILIDGRNENGELVHPNKTFDNWLHWSENKEQLIADILQSSIEYTKEQFKLELSNPSSIWYSGEFE